VGAFVQAASVVAGVAGRMRTDKLLPDGEAWYGHVQAMAEAIQAEAKARSHDGMTGIRDDRAFGLAAAAYEALQRRLHADTP
jgi:hypothetical protein